jgi:hypothetical protein
MRSIRLSEAKVSLGGGASPSTALPTIECALSRQTDVLIRRSQNANSGFQISQTLPAILSVSVSGGKTGLPGCQPEGMSSPVL